ncbi:MAG TPA: DEAD/DEAH box helicase, partial [Pyrinomonadaceae bacterium]|nr:DEAD/DEAH box helicase [Pyrinomonadaceae bacterium]
MRRSTDLNNSDMFADSLSTSMPQYAEVAVPLRVAQTFTYRLPSALSAEARVGARLLVPLGRKLVTGYIVALHAQLDPALELDDKGIKEAEELLDAEPLLTTEVLELTRWLADYYAAPWGEVLKAALPAGLNAAVEQVLTITPEGRDELARLPARKLTTAKARLLQFVADEVETTLRRASELIGSRANAVARQLEQAGWLTLTQRARTAQAKAKRRKAVCLLPPEAHRNGAARALTETQQRIVNVLLAHDGEMLFAELLTTADASASTVQTLERHGIVRTLVRDVRRDPLARAVVPEAERLQLTSEQQLAFDEIAAALAKRTYSAFLLHGVTGSGKTEIYIRAMRAALEQGRSALMLVPEIALTPVFSRRLRAHFGDAVAILHSSLTTGERYDEWSRIRRGAARVVIGTRSAVFAPVVDLGVVIVDEEHESSYRQQESPYYHGRDVAVVR